MFLSGGCRFISDKLSGRLESYPFKASAFLFSHPCDERRRKGGAPEFCEAARATDSVCYWSPPRTFSTAVMKPKRP